jgi:mycofactocin system transcriptional regulator
MGGVNEQRINDPAAGPGPRPGRVPIGRPPSTTRDELARHALALFIGKGFDETTVDDIAAAAGIGRRTFFRYFASKTDVVWGDLETVLARMRARLAASPPDEPLLEAVRQAVVAGNQYGPVDLPEFRARITLIATVPALQSSATLHFAEWRRVLAEFAAERLGQSVDDLTPQAIAHAALGVALAASNEWIRRGDDGSDLPGVMSEALGQLAGGFAVTTARAPAAGG